MRVHASFREDVRLWTSAALGALVLYAVIVLLGIAPSPFPSFSVGRSPASAPVLVAPAARQGADVQGQFAHTRPTIHHAVPAAARRAKAPQRSAPTSGHRRDEGAQTQQPAPPHKTTPSSPTPQPVAAQSAPAPAPPAADVTVPPVVAAPALPLPSLPVSLPTTPDPTAIVPPVALP